MSQLVEQSLRTTTDPQFEFSHQQILFTVNCIKAVKTKIKKERPGIANFLKKRPNYRIWKITYKKLGGTYHSMSSLFGCQLKCFLNGPFPAYLYLYSSFKYI